MNKRRKKINRESLVTGIEHILDNTNLYETFTREQLLFMIRISRAILKGMLVELSQTVELVREKEVKEIK